MVSRITISEKVRFSPKVLSPSLRGCREITYGALDRELLPSATAGNTLDGVVPQED